MEPLKAFELTMAKAPRVIEGATKDKVVEEKRNEMKVLLAFSIRSNV